MRLMLDTANINKIKEYLQYFNVYGVTTNPSILKTVSKEQLFETLKEIKSLLPENTTLHVQVVSLDAEGMYQDAKAICDLLGSNVYIKVPVTKDGLRVIKQLKKEGYHITATAIYTQIQAMLAVNLRADFIAPYINRMQNMGTNAFEIVELIHNHIERVEAKTQILGASFKNVDQVTNVLDRGADYVTVGEEVLDTFLKQDFAEKAASDFLKDWDQQFNSETFLL